MEFASPKKKIQLTRSIPWNLEIQILNLKKCKSKIKCTRQFKTKLMTINCKLKK